MNSKLIGLLALLLVIYFAGVTYAQCTTCTGSIRREIWTVDGFFGPAFPCWVTAPGTSLAACYMCTSVGTTDPAYLVGPKANVDNLCINNACTYPTSNWSTAYTPYPLLRTDPASCTLSNSAAWAWPSNVACMCGGGNRENMKPDPEPEERQPIVRQTEASCPWGSIDPLTHDCSTIAHSLDCPAGGALPAMNYSEGGNCALCDSLVKCYATGAEYNDPSHTCDLISTYGVGTTIPATGLEYPCMRCHNILLNNGSTICGAHVSLTDLCYCSDMLDIGTCTNRRSSPPKEGSLPVAQKRSKVSFGTRDYSGKLCAVWNHVDSATVNCIISDSDGPRIALPSECSLAHAPVECDTHTCGGDAC